VLIKEYYKKQGPFSNELVDLKGLYSHEARPYVYSIIEDTMDKVKSGTLVPRDG
jgi:hypothetical protein